MAFYQLHSLCVCRMTSAMNPHTSSGDCIIVGRDGCVVVVGSVTRVIGRHDYQTTLAPDVEIRELHGRALP